MNSNSMLWGGAFAEAWRLLVDLPLPRHRLFAEHEFAEDDGHLVLAAFPLVGAVLGIAAWSLVWLLGRFLSPAAVAVVAAPLVAVGLEWAVQGRNFTALVTFCAMLGRGRETRPEEAGKEVAGSAVPPLQTPMGMITFMGLFLLRVLAIAVLIHGGVASWLIVTLVLAAQVQGGLALLPDLRSSQVLFPARPGPATEISWTIACLVTLLAGLRYFPAVLLAWLVAWGCQRLAARFCERRFGGVTGEISGAAAYATELVLLLTGLLLLVRD